MTNRFQKETLVKIQELTARSEIPLQCQNRHLKSHGHKGNGHTLKTAAFLNDHVLFADCSVDDRDSPQQQEMQ